MPPEQPSSLRLPITDREQQVLIERIQYLKSTIQIAHELMISQKTVRNHLAHASHKIGDQFQISNGLVSIARFLIDIGFIDPTQIPVPNGTNASLTRRGRNVIGGALSGLGVKETANVLGTARHTVQNQRSSTIRRLGVRCIEDAAILAYAARKMPQP